MTTALRPTAAPDPDGDQIETIAWWQPGQLVDNPALRMELLGDIGPVVGLLGQNLPRMRDFVIRAREARERFAASTERWWERPLSEMEQRAQKARTFAAITTGLDAIVERYRRRMEHEWQSALSALQHRVEGWINSAKIGPREILQRISKAELDLEGFEQALVDGSIECWKFGGEQGIKELELAGADVVKRSPALSFQNTPRVAPDNPHSLGNFTALLKARAFTVRQGFEHDALQAIAGSLQTAYDNGLMPKQAIQRLDDTFKGLASGHMIEPGTPGHDYTKDAVQVTTMRTMGANAFNAARNDLYERNPAFVLGIQLSEVADGHDGERSHPLSQYLHGLTIRMDDPRRKLLAGAKHFCDRKVDIPVTVLDEPVQWSTDAQIDRAIAKGRELSPRFF